MDLSNKIILITGASSGIGKACAELFAKNGAKLILIARRKDRLLEIQRFLKDQYNTKSLIVTLDITKQKEVEIEFNNLPSGWKNIDILINNAGLALGIDKLQDGKFNDWQTMINTNILGLLSITNQVLPNMITLNSGHIVNIGSISSHEVYPGGAVYCATKHAEKILSKGLKMDLTGTKIRVSSIDPGMVETEFSLVRFDQNKDIAKKIYENMTPLSAMDIAETILFTITRPGNVNISQITILPLAQSSTTLINRKGN